MAEKPEIELSLQLMMVIGESVGLDLSDHAARLLADDVNHRLKLVVQDAVKFMHHGKRDMLLVEDIELSLKAKNVEPILGTNVPDDEEIAQPFRFINRGEMEIFVPQETTIDLADLAIMALPKPPVCAQLKAHWLAIDGHQPSLPENPLVISIDEDDQMGKDEKTAQTAAAKMKKGPTNKELVHMKNLAKHEMSLELQIYFEEVTDACIGSDEAGRAAALQSLSMDTGLHQLLPGLCTFVVEGIRVNIVQKNLAQLIYLMRTCKALLDNSSLSMEPFLHELVPAVTSCLVSKSLSANPDWNHWTIREFAARLLKQICKKFHTSANALQPRILRMMAKALMSDNVGLNEKYGAICCLVEFGADCIRRFLLPLVKALGFQIRALLRSAADDEPSNNSGDHSAEDDSTALASTRVSGEHVRDIIVKACVPVLRAYRPLPDVLAEYRADFGYFGKILHTYVVKAREVGFRGRIFAAPVKVAAAASSNNN